jgi:acetolactate synthase-1/2/3 large subunit
LQRNKTGPAPRLATTDHRKAEPSVNRIAASLPPTEPSAHPRAGQSMTGAEIIVQVLADEGVDTIFGYSGGAILPTYDAIFRYNDEQSKRASGAQPMPLIVPANEQGAGFRASAW